MDNIDHFIKEESRLIINKAIRKRRAEEEEKEEFFAEKRRKLAEEKAWKERNPYSRPMNEFIRKNKETFYRYDRDDKLHIFYTTFNGVKLSKCFKGVKEDEALVLFLVWYEKLKEKAESWN